MRRDRRSQPAEEALEARRRCCLFFGRTYLHWGAERFFTAEDAGAAEELQLRKLLEKLLQLTFLCVLRALCGKKMRRVLSGKTRQGLMRVMTTSPGLTSTLAPVHSSCKPFVSMLTRPPSFETTGLTGPAMITRRTPLNRG